MKRLLPKLLFFTLVFLLSVSPLCMKNALAQARIVITEDGSIDPIGAPIERVGETYTFLADISGSIEARRSNIIIDGNHHTLRGGTGSGIGILLDGITYGVKNVTLRNIVVTGFNSAVTVDLSSFNNISRNEISDSSYGIDLAESSHNIISENTIRNCTQGVFVGTSSNNTVSKNVITNPVPNPKPSSTYGIWISGESYNNTFSGNVITNSNFGVRFFFSSLNTVTENNITNNGSGLFLTSASNNTISANTIRENNLNGVYLEDSSNNNTLSGNTVAENGNGIYLTDNSYYNKIHENNFLHNSIQVSGHIQNAYDLGWPTGGNFWSDYGGVDAYTGAYQNLTGRDGLGDISQPILLDNPDHYPLMGLFSCHQLSPDHRLSLISNSSIESLNYFSQNGTIKIQATNTSTTQLFGFMRVTVPKAVIIPPYTVTIDATETPLYLDDALHDTATHRWMYIAYQHSAREISIQGILPDITPPTIEIQSPENKLYNTRDVPLIFTVNEPTTWIGYSLDGHNNLTVSGNTTVMGLQDGPHTIKIYANDTSGNLGGSATASFSIEATTPAVQILSPENKTYNARGVLLAFTISEPTSWIGFSLNNGRNSTISGNFTISNLLNGTYSVTVYANDTSGNMGHSNTVHFTISVSSLDVTPPQILITSPANKTYTTADGTVDIQLTCEVNEPVTWIAYSLDQKPNTTITGNTTLFGLSKGVHSVAVYALDAAGNTGASSTVQFSVEAPAPAEPFPPAWLLPAAIATVIAAGTVVVVYIRKTRKKT
jgi:parallel beta-helix repeat protein